MAGSFAGRTQKSAGQVSRVRTAFLEMELNHDSGAMRGRIVRGRREEPKPRRAQSTTLIGLLGEIDDDSRDLLAERTLTAGSPAGGVGAAQGDAGAGSRTRAAASGKIAEEEAYQILGVQPGATAKRQPRPPFLMKKLHPDQGGSTYLAARVNEAKDVLLRRHR